MNFLNIVPALMLAALVYGTFRAIKWAWRDEQHHESEMTPDQRDREYHDRQW